jgi:hypothetical protein
MPSELYHLARMEKYAAAMRATRLATQQPRRQLRTGVVTGNGGTISVDGQVFQFRSSGLSLAQGTHVTVENIGTPAVAVYALSANWRQPL